MMISGERATSSGAVSPSWHLCGVPTSDEELWEMSAGFIAEGLAAQERVTYFEDGTAQAVLDRLADDHVPVGAALARGQLEIVPAERTRALVAGPAELAGALLGARIAESLADGWRGWRTTGQFSHGLQALGPAGLLRFDRALDGGLAGRPARALCLYDRRRYPEAALPELCAVHPGEVGAPSVYDDGLLRITRGGLGRARLAGEADHSNDGMIDRLLGVVLDEVLRSPAGLTEVTLDLASLRFLDVAGAAALVHGAEQFPDTHRLVLRDVRPPVLRVLDRCGSPFVPQLDVVARAPGHPSPAPDVRRAG